MLSIKTSLCSALLLATQAVAVAQWSGTQAAGNLTVEYCSKENTGVKNDQGSDIYNTLGLCNDKCVGKFAYAVLQYQECWCTNDKPTDQVDIEKCDQKCPGYPDQNCGSKDAGLFGYVPLEGGDSASSAASTSASPSSASNATAPAMTSSSSSGSKSTSSASQSGNSTSTSDAATASYTGGSASLAVSSNALAASAIICLGMGYAFGFSA